MNIQKIILPAASVILALLIQSCNHIDGNYQTTYKPAPAIKKEGLPVANSLFITNLKDTRPEDERIPIDPNINPLLLLPLWPYTHSESSPVLKYTYMQADMLNTVKHLVAKDIRTSNIFDSVVTQSFEVNSTDNSDPAIPENAYILQIDIKRAVWSRYLTTYGLSYPGSVLWFFLPMSYGSVTVTMEAELYAPDNRKSPVVTETFTKEISCTEWTYDQINYLPPISEFRLAELFPLVMADLRDFLIKNTLENNK